MRRVLSTRAAGALGMPACNSQHTLHPPPSPPNFVMASVLSGLLEALTPLSIICGAIMLFNAMEATKVGSWGQQRAGVHAGFIPAQ